MIKNFQVFPKNYDTNIFLLIEITIYVLTVTTLTMEITYETSAAYHCTLRGKTGVTSATECSCCTATSLRSDIIAV